MDYLIDILNILLEYYMNENLLIKTCSYKCLLNIAKNCHTSANTLTSNCNVEHESSAAVIIEHLLTNNYDYVMNKLYLSVKNLTTKEFFDGKW